MGTEDGAKNSGWEEEGGGKRDFVSGLRFATPYYCYFVWLGLCMNDL